MQALRRTRRALAVVSILAITITASAQEQGNPLAGSPVVVGSRVRLRSSAIQGRPRGLVVAMDDTSLTLANDGGLPLKLGLASITSIDTSLARKRNTFQGLAAGVLAGMITGSRVAVNPNDCGPQSTNFCSHGEAITGFSIVFGGLGAAVGALVKSDRWAKVTLSATPRVQQGKTGLGLDVALRF